MLLQQYYELTLSFDTIYKMVMILLYTWECSVLAIPEAAEDMPASVCCGVHAVRNSNI